MWSRFEVLFNAKHPLYYNKAEKGKALNKIKGSLESNGYSFSTKDIAENIANLRNYYEAQRRIVEVSAKSGAGTNEIYESKWKFFNQLNFLNDNLIPRNSKSNISSPAVCSPENVKSVYQLESTRSTKSKKKIEENQINELQGVIKTALTRLDKLNSNDNPTMTTQLKSADEIFGELVVKTLGEIKDCEEKDLIKLEIQQKLI